MICLIPLPTHKKADPLVTNSSLFYLRGGLFMFILSLWRRWRRRSRNLLSSSWHDFLARFACGHVVPLRLRSCDFWLSCHSTRHDATYDIHNKHIIVSLRRIVMVLLCPLMLTLENIEIDLTLCTDSGNVTLYHWKLSKLSSFIFYRTRSWSIAQSPNLSFWSRPCMVIN